MKCILLSSMIILAGANAFADEMRCVASVEGIKETNQVTLNKSDNGFSGKIGDYVFLVDLTDQSLDMRMSYAGLPASTASGAGNMKLPTVNHPSAIVQKVLTSTFAETAKIACFAN